MALGHGRHGELLGLVAPILLAPALAPQLAARIGERGTSVMDRVLAALTQPANLRGMAVAGAVLLAISAVAFRGDLAREADDSTPAAALAAVKAQHLEGPVFNDYAFGGYLIYSGIAPFVDGRVELYGDAFLNRYFNAVFLLSGELPQLLGEYRVTWTLLSAQSQAAVLLDHLPGWRRLYADDIAVVHVRDDQPAR
jgi:hypothetical protein